MPIYIDLAGPGERKKSQRTNTATINLRIFDFIVGHGCNLWNEVHFAALRQNIEHFSSLAGK